MKDKIEAAIKMGHSSMLNGISITSATLAVERLFKKEVESILEEFLEEFEDNLWLNDETERVLYEIIDKVKTKYNIDD